MKFLALTLFVFVTLGLNAQAKILSQTYPAPDYCVLEVESPAIKANTSGFAGNVTLHVLLPPNYDPKGTKNFPVVYFLNGFGDDPAQVRGWLTGLKKTSWNFIIVGVEGRNQYDGSFYVNSPVTGGWEDWTVKEAIEIIDRNFHTIAHKNSRGIAGYSMGGFGALNLGLKHPEIFNAVLATGPGVWFTRDDMRKAWGDWQSMGEVIQAYAEALAPVQNNGDIQGLVPDDFSGTPDDLKARDQWWKGFGDWEGKINTYKTLKFTLKALFLEWGDKDFYTWIRTGTAQLLDLMKLKGLNAEGGSFSGAHVVSQSRLREVWIPFFQKNLEF